MSRKFGRKSQANLLRADGVPALGTTELQLGQKLNPIQYYSPNKERYKMIWTNYDLNQCVSRYKWNGLPKGISSWNLERMLYFRNTLAGFEIAGRVYIMPYFVQGRINPYGMPTAIKPITYNGNINATKNDYINFNKSIPVEYDELSPDPTKAVLLFDNVPITASGKGMSRFFLNQVIINEMVDVFARININVVVSNKKILLVIKDAKQRDVVQKELEVAFGSDSPFAIITSPLDVNSIQNSGDYNADDLFNTIKNFDSIRCFMSGITSSNFGEQKKERLISGELQGSQEQCDLIADMGLELRQLFCDQMNRKFGLSMSVEKRNSEYDEEVNGANRTFEEEGEQL